MQSFLAHDSYPETHYHHRHHSRFDAYAAYVNQRWEQGCHNIEQIWREVKSQGYPHSDRALRAQLEPLRARGKTYLPEATSLDRFSAKAPIHTPHISHPRLMVVCESACKARREATPTGRTHPKGTP